MEFIAWIGNFLLAICGLPLAIEAIRKKQSVVPTLFYFTWLFGEIFVFIYTFSIKEWALVFNYTCNLVFLSIVGYYKFKKLDP